MIKIQLPDNSVLEFDGPVSGLDVAKHISEGLARAAFAVTVNGKLTDLTTPITTDSAVTIVTAKTTEGLDTLRHTASHVMAQAVQELFPGTQVTIGPVVENGFYYDFAKKEPFTTEDLEKIEHKMAEIVDRDLPIERQVWSREQAIQYFTDKGEHLALDGDSREARGQSG